MYLVSISAGLLVWCCSAALGLWAFRRCLTKRSDARIVVIEKVLSPHALGANSTCTEDNPVISADSTKHSNSEAQDDVSTDVSSSQSDSSDQSVDSIKVSSDP